VRFVRRERDTTTTAPGSSKANLPLKAWLREPSCLREVYSDPFDGVGRRHFVDGGHGKDRLALVERFVRERAFGAPE
jgi:hypothetical protein